MTDHSNLSIYEQLRHALIFGSFEPSEKLKIDVLKQTFSAGQNAIREALVRLSVEGLVVAEDQKGFRVAPVGVNELSDLAYLRTVLEREGVGRSIELGDLEWEGRVAGAMRKLNRIEEALLTDDSKIEIWTQYDLEFHQALMSACNSPLLMRTYQDLFVKFRQFVVRELKTEGFRGQEIIQEHLQIGQAALDHDRDICLRLLQEHATTYVRRQQVEASH